jgi:hypothetical protein
MQSLRNNWDNYWQDVLYYCIPRKSYITRKKEDGSRLPVDVYDSAGIEALRIFSSGLHGYLTNPSSKWFNLRTENRDLMDSKEVKVWLKDTEDKIYDTINGSNFDTSMLEGYTDFGSVGLCVIFLEDDPIDYVRFYARPIKEIYIDQNEREIIDTVYRVFEFTVRQAYRKWGENCSKDTIEKYNKGKYEDKVTILHAVEPRFDYHPGKKDSLNMPFASVYIEKEAKKKLSEGGYKSFPYMIAGANKESGELYFTSPMMECFSDTKMVNKMTETNIKAGMTIAAPPLDVPHDGFMGPINLNPGAVNYRNSEVGGVDYSIRPIQTGANVPMTLEMIDRVDKKIQRALFVDLFLALAQRDPKMTATEVMAREQERMLLLGPMIGRLTNMFSSMIKRTYEILLDRGVIAPPPPALQVEKNLVIDYVSPLAKAQRGSDIKSIQTVINLVAPIAQAAPQVLDKIDTDKYVDEIADLTGVNPELIRDKSEVEEIRQARATAEAAAKKMQAMDVMAGAADKGASAAKQMAEAQGVK